MRSYWTNVALSPTTGVLIRRPHGDTQGEDSHVTLGTETRPGAVVTGDEDPGGALAFSSPGSVTPHVIQRLERAKAVKSEVLGSDPGSTGQLRDLGRVPQPLTSEVGPYKI